MTWTRNAVLLLVVSLLTNAVAAQNGPWDIGVDVGGASGTPTVTPAKPVARIGEDDILTIQILNGGKVPAEDRALLRFPQPVLDLTATAGGFTLARRTLMIAGIQQPQFTQSGTAHLLRFRKCSDRYFTGWKWPGGTAVTENDCPLIVSNGPQNLTVYANSDSIALIADVDVRANAADPAFDPTNVRRSAFTIRTVRPYWNLNFSTGFSFFADDSLRDEKYRLVPATNDADTPDVDESTTEPQQIISAGHGSTAYEFGAFATYMFHRPTLPLGVTFGVSTKIPVDQLTAVAGLTGRIKPFPITDSAYVTVGFAYRGHQRLQPKYRDTLLAPAGLEEADILDNEHDVGLFVAVSFGFGGGDTQFKKVVSGQ